MGRWQWWCVCVCVVKAKVKLACCTKSDADRKAAQDTNATQRKIRLLAIPAVIAWIWIHALVSMAIINHISVNGSNTNNAIYMGWVIIVFDLRSSHVA